MFWISALYPDFEDAKNLKVFKVLIWKFYGDWRFLTGVLHLDLDLCMSLSLIHPHFEFWLSIFILKVQRKSMPFKSWFGVLMGAGASWLGLCILISLEIWSLVFNTPRFQMLTLCLNFEGTKNIHVLKVLISSFSGVWRLLIGVWHLGLHLDMVNGLCYTYIPNFGTVFWIWRCKEHLCPLTPDL